MVVCLFITHKLPQSQVKDAVYMTYCYSIPSIIETAEIGKMLHANIKIL